ncbi:UvrD-helicase domain-containing protein [Croceivirga thetidis]|uniref:DNA 3'-5' helicase n=1 Tax=Croceivirga thetidis TaxID=2721623 RepID=A0ABX1GP62_9FLAO|nr:UvrD-helicase domain-containing protein [Croceivirga thetidis]NKI31369.1 UvrD-helicase domain-containing protein [Croceivirga thetidis]
MKTSNFKILSASAGTGKTYRLAKAYLSLLLNPEGGQNLRNLLAITFTNKAVGEMRQRILNNLKDFAFNESVAQDNTLFTELSLELNLSYSGLKDKSKKVLKRLLHNYAFFEITTIDGFNHNLIRTFAKDLKVAQNFEVELDTDLILGQVISRILNRVGSDEVLTKTLIDFSLEKIEDDKSWDIVQNLLEIGKLIFNENHYNHLLNLKSKSQSDFVDLKNTLKSQEINYSSTIKESATKCLKLIDESGLEFSDFNRSYFPKFLEQAKNNPGILNFTAKWKQNFGEEPLYTKTKDETIKSSINSLLPEFVKFFEVIMTSFNKSEFLKKCQKNVVPLSLLAEIITEFETLKKEEGFLTIPEFNQLISQELKKQPVPYIYERLGERYQNYFIDEFQDTSTLQWNNLIPLISHALESENLKGKTGSLFLVGDVKQSIYRWRGGEPKQFLDLVVQNENPFMVSPEIEQLSKNWRSHEEIVNFNNSFFSFCSTKFSNTEFAKAYKDGNQQLTNTKKGGIVSISFLPKKNINPINESPHCNKTKEIIQSILNKGYLFEDICILVRSKKDGITMADFLQQQNIPIVSSEALLLKNNTEVQFILSFFRILVNPESEEDIFNILNYLDKKGSHDFIRENLVRFPQFIEETYELKIDSLKSLGLLSLAHELIITFDLAKQSSAFLNFFIDELFEFENKKKGSILDFLEFWGVHSEKLSVRFNEGENAIQIMTIHKAKGLEFPFVIYPFADSVINDATKQENLWFQVNKEQFAGFSELLVKNNRYMEHFSNISKSAHEIENQKAELDDFNVLYVALTRAVLGLYIISTPVNKISSSKNDSYSSLFNEYVNREREFAESNDNYAIGELVQNAEIHETNTSLPIDYSGQSFLEYNFDISAETKLNSTSETKQSMFYGTLVHEALANVFEEHDISKAVNKARINNKLSFDSANHLEETIKKVVHHDDLNHYFKKGLEVLNEVEILKEDGTQVRPDKIIIDGANATIIDYKTGVESSKHKTQLSEYADCLGKMGFTIENKILVYINDNIKTLAI